MGFSLANIDLNQNNNENKQDMSSSTSSLTAKRYVATVIVASNNNNSELVNSITILKNNTNESSDNAAASLPKNEDDNEKVICQVASTLRLLGDLLELSSSINRQRHLQQQCHRIVNPNDESGTTLIGLASEGLLNFVEQLSQQARLEYTSVVVFSSLYDVLVKFTRDFDEVKRALMSLTTCSKTVFETVFRKIESLVIEEWGIFVPIELVVVTDGQCGIGDGSLRESLTTLDGRKTENRFPLPFSFPCHTSIVCLSADGKDKSYFEKLIDMNYKKGDLYLPESLTKPGIAKCFGRLLNMRYNKYETVLKCGYFQSDITLLPPPSFQNSYTAITNLYKHPSDIVNTSKLKLSNVLNIIGFLDIQDFSHPSFLSRHLVSPIAVDSTKEKQEPTSNGITSIFSSNTKPKEAAFQPSFCVLLHGSLKTEKMGGVVQLGDNWYGMLFSYSDNKKRASLMLSIFEPGISVPWLGDIQKLGPAYELPDNPYQINSKDNSEETPFPVPAPRQRSYRSSSTAVWIKSSGLQSDVQKVLRYAKKLPDKQSAFFKEVNKLRRAGVIYGFHDLLNALALTLEKEVDHPNKEVSVQLSHVAEGLRNAPNRDLNKNIIPIAFRKKSSD